MSNQPPKLTSLSHGGGCGCKIAPNVLTDLLARLPASTPYANLLVGHETSDDAAVYRLNEEQALVATTDFFMPVVDDPYDFGRIAATNALSDIYAMGATPIFALAILGMPVQVLPPDVIAQILRGGQSVCQAAGIPVAGGHSIDSVEPIYGLVALGLAHPAQIRRNSDAQVGDLVVLGKPIGVGVYSSALKQGLLDDTGYAAMIASTTALNKAGSDLAQLPHVRAMTDVTGFGLLGHALEIAKASGVDLHIESAQVPFLPGVDKLAALGCVTGASKRNWASYGHQVSGRTEHDMLLRDLLTDPQTSGGLLVACAADQLETVLECFTRQGAHPAVIGEVCKGSGRVRVL
jgi:selenide, water dikinase